MVSVLRRRMGWIEDRLARSMLEDNLGSYVLLNLFFGVRFFLSYRIPLERATDRALRSLRQGMIEIWTGDLDALVEELARLRNEAQARGKELSELAGRASAKPWKGPGLLKRKPPECEHGTRRGIKTVDLDSMKSYP